MKRDALSLTWRNHTVQEMIENNAWRIVIGPLAGTLLQCMGRYSRHYSLYGYTF